MDWDGSLLRSGFPNSRPDSSSSAFTSFLFNSNFDHFPANYMEVKNQAVGIAAEPLQGLGFGADKYSNNNYLSSQERKKKLTSDQLESLERSFREEIKLDPDRKMKLSKDLGLQPRQIAVWFQNRRARWKAKQLERLYDALKQEFDIISRDKLRLQEEVLRLKALIRDQTGKKKQVYTEVSGEETVESTSIDIHSSYTTRPRGAVSSHHHQIAESSFLLSTTLDEYNTVSAASYWGVVPPAYNNP